MKKYNTKSVNQQGGVTVGSLNDNETPPLEPELKITYGWGTTSFVTGIIGVFAGWVMPYVTIFSAVFGIIAYHQQSKIKLNGLATAGLVLNIFTILISILMLFVIWWLISIGSINLRG